MSDRFEVEKRENIQKLGERKDLSDLSVHWLTEMCRHKYSYHFSWMGRPIIQFPQDIIAMQEIIWSVRPDLIVETGVARGGSLVFYASMLELVGAPGRVIGIDLDIRPSNREALEQHPMFGRIELIEGSSLDPSVVSRVSGESRGARSVLVALDSNHTHAHVLRELELYSPLVTRGSYLVVFDTVIEDMPEDFFADRPWGVGNNPKTAVREFLSTNDRFEVDREFDHKLQVTVAPEGYLRCIRD